MRLRLSNLPGTASAMAGLAGFVLLQRRRVFEILERSIEAAGGPGYRMPPLELHRLREYVLLGPALGEMFCSLRGSPMEPEERQAFVNLSIFAPLFDDLFDRPDFPEERLQAIISDHRAVVPDGFTERLLIGALEQIHAGISDPEEFRDHFRKVFQAQKESKLQAEGRLDADAVRRITHRKGGHSALLYRRLLRNHPVSGEDEAFFELGALIQLMDDIFDVHDDHAAGVRTLGTACTDISQLAGEYGIQLARVCALFRRLDYDRKNIRALLHKVLVLASRGMVCLEQFLRLQRRNGGSFHPGHYTQKELLCDMETASNFLRSLHFCLTYELDGDPGESAAVPGRAQPATAEERA